MDKPKIAVIGGGLMGHGIAYMFAMADHKVGLAEPSVQVRDTLAQRWQIIIDLFDDDPHKLTNISVYERLPNAAEDAQFVFEAAPEKLGLKQLLFSELESVVSPQTILASNSSAIPTTEIARKLKNRERVVGTHFWNPPHLVPLVEVIQNEWTSRDTVIDTMELLYAIGRKPVHVRKDIPGFIGNRLQHALKREAIALVAAGVCDAETLDTVVKEGFGSRLTVLGPMEQSDLVGVDLTLDIAEVLVHDLDRSDKPHPFLRQLVADGKLGMKTGEGFRRWTPQQAEEVRERLRNYLAMQAKARALADK